MSSWHDIKTTLHPCIFLLHHCPALHWLSLPPIFARRLLGSNSRNPLLPLCPILFWALSGIGLRCWELCTELHAGAVETCTIPYCTRSAATVRAHHRGLATIPPIQAELCWAALSMNISQTLYQTLHSQIGEEGDAIVIMNEWWSTAQVEQETHHITSHHIISHRHKIKKSNNGERYRSVRPLCYRDVLC